MRDVKTVDTQIQILVKTFNMIKKDKDGKYPSKWFALKNKIINLKTEREECKRFEYLSK